ncbi:hypothetical protein J6590_039395 [Homalodisca vitripennis]|nr:hypothetical protein J6590_039395 [Homalodisca vitripennis]
MCRHESCQRTIWPHYYVCSLFYRGLSTELAEHTVPTKYACDTYDDDLRTCLSRGQTLRRAGGPEESNERAERPGTCEVRGYRTDSAMLRAARLARCLMLLAVAEWSVSGRPGQMRGRTLRRAGGPEERNERAERPGTCEVRGYRTDSAMLRAARLARCLMLLAVAEWSVSGRPGQMRGRTLRRAGGPEERNERAERPGTCEVRGYRTGSAMLRAARLARCLMLMAVAERPVSGRPGADIAPKLL